MFYVLYSLFFYKLIFFRLFKLLLYPDTEIFDDDISFESTNGPVNFNPGVAYTGTLEG